MSRWKARGILIVTIILSLGSNGFSQDSWEKPMISLVRELVFSRSSIGFGARALAMGGAFTAIADDITALRYNPAGLAQLIRPEISFGASYWGLSLKNSGASIDSANWASIQVGPINPNEGLIGLDYVGLAVPFRLAGLPVVLGMAYEKKISNMLKMGYDQTIEYSGQVGSPERGISALETTSFKNSGGINNATISLAVRPTGFLHVGANLNWNRINMTESWDYIYERSYYDSGGVYGETLLEYSWLETLKVDQGLSYDVGVLLKFNFFSLGVVFKKDWHARLASPYIYERHFTDMEGVKEDLVLTGEDGGELFWPYSLNAGLSVRPMDPLTISMDYGLSKWSEGQIAWDDWPAVGFPIRVDPQDSRVLRLGIEYLVFFNNVAVPLRIGGFRDSSIGLDTSGDYYDFWGLTLGSGFSAKNVVLDLAAVYRFGDYDIVAGDLSADPILTNVSNWTILASMTFRLGR